MPELPEVETIKNDLKKKILGKKIKQVTIRKKRLVRGSARAFVRELKGNSFKDIKRIGKLLIFTLNNGKYLLIHLKMTGQLVYRRNKKIIAGGHGSPKITEHLPNKYSHIYFKFNDDSGLYFNDMRQFGFVQIVSKPVLEKIIAGFGPEPLSRQYKIEEFKEIFKNRKTSVKAVLLNQKLIAGIGNIYADEILFTAGVRPDRRAGSLKQQEMENIFNATKSVLRKAIKYRGTTFNDYVDASGNVGRFVRHLKVYGREGERCKKCEKGIILKAKVAQRGTQYCKVCQK